MSIMELGFISGDEFDRIKKLTNITVTVEITKDGRVFDKKGFIVDYTNLSREEVINEIRDKTGHIGRYLSLIPVD